MAKTNTSATTSEIVLNHAPSYPFSVPGDNGEMVQINSAADLRLFMKAAKKAGRTEYKNPKIDMNKAISTFKRSWHKAQSAADRKAALANLGTQLEGYIDVLRK